MEVINTKRVAVWQQQPHAFFERAIIEADGSIFETAGECKQGMDLSYDGRWGYHPLIVSLANTQELLCLEDRCGRRRSQEGAAANFDRAATLGRQTRFHTILLRGETRLTQREQLARWA